MTKPGCEALRKHGGSQTCIIREMAAEALLVMQADNTNVVSLRTGIELTRGRLEAIVHGRPPLGRTNRSMNVWCNWDPNSKRQTAVGNCLGRTAAEIQKFLKDARRSAFIAEEAELTI